MLPLISYRAGKKNEMIGGSGKTRHGRDRIAVNGDSCRKFSKRRSSLCLRGVARWEASQLEVKTARIKCGMRLRSASRAAAKPESQ